ncbi:MAG: hypothetical protein JJE04_04070 [Acidobacteriia bacterium]|nr:hypothetical protein [Terriglobia bacterium]
MNFLRKYGLVFLASISIATLEAADKKAEAFRPGPASSYSNRQKQGGIVVAADPFVTAEQSKRAFDKVHPYEHGALPILFLIENTTSHTIDLKQMRAVYIDASRSKLSAIPAGEVKFLKPPDKPKPNVSGLPRFKKKNPLAAEEIESRAFAAKMLPPGESAHGFFYFPTDHRAGAILYVRGLRDATTGEELFYMEIPLPNSPGH